MSTTNEPVNKNPYDSNRYRLLINQLPTVTFFVQRGAIPSVSLGSAKRATAFTDIDLPGDKIRWADLSAQFLLDEDLLAWKEVFTWMIALGRPDDHQEYAALLESSQYISRPGVGGLYSDATITILNSAFRPSMEIKFIDIWPTYIAEIPLDGTASEVQNPLINVSFRYQRYIPRIL